MLKTHMLRAAFIHSIFLVTQLRFDKPGENGQPVFVDDNEKELEKKLFDVNGYSGLVSDKIAVKNYLMDLFEFSSCLTCVCVFCLFQLNRSVADFRHNVRIK